MQRSDSAPLLHNLWCLTITFIKRPTSLNMTFEVSHHLIPVTVLQTPQNPAFTIAALPACSNLSLFMLFHLKCYFPTSLPNVTPTIKLSRKALFQSQFHPAELLVHLYSPIGSFSHLHYSTNYTVLKSHAFYVSLSERIGHSLKGGPQAILVWKVCIRQLLLYTRHYVHYSSSAVTYEY